MDDALWIIKHIEKGFCHETLALAIEIYDECVDANVDRDLLAIACVSIAAKFEEAASISVSRWVRPERCAEAMRAELAVLDRISFSVLPLSRRHAIARLGEICLSHDACYRLARRLVLAALATNVRRECSAWTLAWSALQIARGNESKFDHPSVKSMILALRNLCVSSNS